MATTLLTTETAPHTRTASDEDKPDRERPGFRPFPRRVAETPRKKITRHSTAAGARSKYGSDCVSGKTHHHTAHLEPDYLARTRQLYRFRGSGKLPTHTMTGCKEDRARRLATICSVSYDTLEFPSTTIRRFYAGSTSSRANAKIADWGGW